MRREYHLKTFKSGNSIAIRLPKALGFVEGEEVAMITHADGTLSFWRVRDARKVLLGLYGRMSPGFMAEGRGDIEQDERNWNKPSREAA